MINYYEILGIEPTASIAEIKFAFRSLAKLYHPDKNPNGKDYFTTLLKAYEVLSDAKTRSRYDLQFKYRKNIPNDEFNNTKKKVTKTWRFDEEELKRRQYYNEHFKKQMQDKNPMGEADLNKINYNEFKYIFFAIPIAVALFLLIMKLAQTK